MFKYILILSIVLFTTIAMGHNWYPIECCSGIDCKPIPCEDIIELKDNTFSYNNIIYTKDLVKESLDSFCHACPRCLFIKSLS